MTEIKALIESLERATADRLTTENNHEKTALLCCQSAWGKSINCEYHACVGQQAATDRLALYETQVPALLAEYKAMEARCEAAERDLEQAGPCFTCKHFRRNGGECSGGGRCRIDGAEIQPCDRPGEYRVLIPDDGRNTYEWRGPEAEQGGPG
jgi:hypothetical protein